VNDQRHSEILSLGSGPAGCTAAIYAARANRSTRLIDGAQPGGQLTITTDVENYPGFASPIQGPWLMDQMREQAIAVGTDIVTDAIVSVDLSRRPFRCVGESGVEYFGDALVIATGASARWLGIESEQRFRGFGVSACATCDGFFFRGKRVAVIGGGNSAVEEAIYLSQHASHVTVIHRRDEFRAERILQQRLLQNPKISVIWDTAVAEVLGKVDPLSVTGLRLKNLKTADETVLDVDGMFVAIGHVPNTALFKDQLEMDEHGYLVTVGKSTSTNVSGVFATGDAQDSQYRQAVTAAGTGCMGALEADRFLVVHGGRASTERTAEYA
jgi:thioredoxin reductase (NADPH)